MWSFTLMGEGKCKLQHTQQVDSQYRLGVAARFNRTLMTNPETGTTNPIFNVDRRLALGLVFGCVCLAYLDDLLLVIDAWLAVRGFFSHGFLVLGVVGLLLWERRATILNTPEPVSWVLLSLTFAGTLVWLVAWAADIQALRLAAMVGILLCACTAVLGNRSLLTFGIPFALLFLAVPIWRPLVPVLQSIAADVVHQVIAATQIPAFIDGNFIHIPAGIFEVAGGCSGLGFLLVSVFFAIYLLLQAKHRISTIVTTISVAVLFGLLVNWLRIFLIITVAHLFGFDNWVVTEHVWFGWTIYVTLGLPLGWWASKKFMQAPPATDGVKINPRTVSASFPALLVALCVAVPLFSLTMERMASEGTLQKTLEKVQPDRFERVHEAPMLHWGPEYPYADYTYHATFTDQLSGDQLQVLEAVYVSQTDGQELIGMHNQIADPRYWRPFAGRNREISSGGQSYRLSEALFRNENNEYLCVWYWYRIGTEYAGNEATAKLNQITDKLRGRTGGTIVAAAMPGTDGHCDNAAGTLTRYHSSALAANGF